MRNHTSILIAVILILQLFAISKTYTQTKPNESIDLISKENLMQTAGFLSSDGFSGRLQGSIEYEMAARYVANRFKQMGLKPIGHDSFLHFFDVEFNTIDYAEISLLRDDGEIEKDLVLGEDFVCRGFSGGGTFSAPVVFAGYGISTKDYDDYSELDVNGKLVIVFKTAPGWNNPQGAWGDNSPRAKARTAKSKGAVGILIVTPSMESPQRELIGSVACGEPPHMEDFPMVQISSKVANELLSNYSYTLESLYSRINENKRPFSFEVNKKIQVDISTSYNPKAPTPNVVAVWEGSHRRRKRNYIVVGAHLDHVGTQASYLTFPGANDNASGVASLIEMARVLKESGIQTERSILFVVFSAEESGLHGSKHFVENSPINTERMVAMLNFDCVAQGDSVAIGGKHSFPILWSIADTLDKKYTNLLSGRTFGGGGADAEAFYRKGIPTLYFNTSGGYKYLHLPTDRAETLNPELFEKLTKLGLATLIELANGRYRREKDMLMEENIYKE